MSLQMQTGGQTAPLIIFKEKYFEAFLGVLLFFSARIFPFICHHFNLIQLDKKH